MTWSDIVSYLRLPQEVILPHCSINWTQTPDFIIFKLSLKEFRHIKLWIQIIAHNSENKISSYPVSAAGSIRSRPCFLLIHYSPRKGNFESSIDSKSRELCQPAFRVGTIHEFSRIVNSWFISGFKKRIAIHWINSFYSIIL